MAKLPGMVVALPNVRGTVLAIEYENGILTGVPMELLKVNLNPPRYQYSLDTGMVVYNKSPYSKWNYFEEKRWTMGGWELHFLQCALNPAAKGGCFGQLAKALELPKAFVEYVELFEKVILYSGAIRITHRVKDQPPRFWQYDEWIRDLRRKHEATVSNSPGE